MALDLTELIGGGGARETTFSTNRQVGLASAFARALKLRPRDKLLQTLIRLPGGSYAVVLLARPKSYSAALRQALAGTTTPGGADRFVRRLRGEWKR